MISCICLYSGDWEQPDFTHVTFPKAAKPHHCCECGAEIKKGEKYELTKGKWDGRMDTHKTCIPCMNVRNHLMVCGWVYGQLWEDIREHFRGTEPEEGDDYEWLK